MYTSDIQDRWANRQVSLSLSLSSSPSPSLPLSPSPSLSLSPNPSLSLSPSLSPPPSASPSFSPSPPMCSGGKREQWGHLRNCKEEPGVGKGCIETATVRRGLSGHAEVRGPSLCPWEQAGSTAWVERKLNWCRLTWRKEANRQAMSLLGMKTPEFSGKI